MKFYNRTNRDLNPNHDKGSRSTVGHGFPNNLPRLSQMASAADDCCTGASCPARRPSEALQRVTRDSLVGLPGLGYIFWPRSIAYIPAL